MIGNVCGLSDELRCCQILYQHPGQQVQCGVMDCKNMSSGMAANLILMV
jgi:hypothetical protein